VSVPYGPSTPRTSFKKGKTCVRTQSHAPLHQTSPPGSGELGCYHTSRDTNSRPLAPSGSGVTTRPVVPAPTSQLEGSSGAATRPVASAPTSRHFGCRHVSHDASSRLPAQGSSGAAMCPTTLCRPRVIKVYEYSPIELLS
jgi:hypothetical protein